LIAFAGGTIVIAIMVISAFATIPAAGAKTCPRSQPAESAESAETKSSNAQSADA